MIKFEGNKFELISRLRRGEKKYWAQNYEAEKNRLFAHAQINWALKEIGLNAPDEELIRSMKNKEDMEGFLCFFNDRFNKKSIKFVFYEDSDSIIIETTPIGKSALVEILGEDECHQSNNNNLWHLCSFSFEMRAKMEGLNI